MSLLGGGAQFPKVQLSGLSPVLLVDILSVFSPLPTHKTAHLPFPEHPRQGDLNVDRGRRCPSLPLPLSLRTWGAWQHVEEGPVILLTEACF